MVEVKYVTIEKHAQQTGYSIDAINSKIRDGVWRQGEVWIKAPDGRRLISIEGYNEWVEIGLACEKRVKTPSKSPLPLRV